MHNAYGESLLNSCWHNPSQVAYQMAWHDIIGDRELIIERGKGPDMASSLYLFNCRVDYVSELRKISASYLNWYIDHWDYLEENWLSRPPGMPVQKGWLPQDVIRFKSYNGYFDNAMIDALSVERLIAMDLKSMKIAPDAIDAFEHDQSTVIRFPWAYPGQKEESRTIVYNSDMAACLSCAIPGKVKGFFQKSVPSKEGGLDALAADLGMLMGHLSDMSVVCLGKDFSSARTKEIWDIGHGCGLEITGPSAEGLYTDFSIEFVDRWRSDTYYDNDISYGMELMVFRHH